MKTVPLRGVAPERSRRAAAVVVADPHIVVVEGSDAADPEALEDALDLLVKWAVRARSHGRPAFSEAATVDRRATCIPEN